MTEHDIIFPDAESICTKLWHQGGKFTRAQFMYVLWVMDNDPAAEHNLMAVQPESAGRPSLLRIHLALCFLCDEAL